MPSSALACCWLRRRQSPAGGSSAHLGWHRAHAWLVAALIPTPSKGPSRRAGGPGILGDPSLSRGAMGERHGEAGEVTDGSGRDRPAPRAYGSKRPARENGGAAVLAGGQPGQPREPSAPPRLHHAKWTPRVEPGPPPPPPARPAPLRPPQRSPALTRGPPKGSFAPAGSGGRRGGATTAPRSPPPLYTSGAGRPAPPHAAPMNGRRAAGEAAAARPFRQPGGALRAGAARGGVGGRAGSRWGKRLSRGSVGRDPGLST